MGGGSGVAARVWREAFEAAAFHDDTQPLLLLLTTRTTCSSEARHLIGDLLERRSLQKSRGRPKTPAYTFSDIEKRVAGAKRSYHTMLRNNWEKEDALETAAKSHHIGIGTLDDALNHMRGRPKPLDGPRSLDEAEAIQPWVKAIKALDLNNDVQPLIDLLRGNAPWSRLVGRILADVFCRYKLAMHRHSSG